MKLMELQGDRVRGSQRKQLLSFALFRARNRATHCVGAALGLRLSPNKGKPSGPRGISICPAPTCSHFPLTWNIRSTQHRNKQGVLIFQIWVTNMTAACPLHHIGNTFLQP